MVSIKRSQLEKNSVPSTKSCKKERHRNESRSKKSLYTITKEKNSWKQSHKIFDPHDYKCNKSIANYFSMGIDYGMFNIKDHKRLHKFIANGVNEKMCFVELRTPYYQLFYDLDINDKKKNNKLDFFKNKHINILKFWKYIIKFILSALNYYIVDSDNTFDYVYSDRSDDIKHKIHVFFPNIIVNSTYALTIRKKAIELIKIKNKYNLPDKYLKDIFDSCVYTTNGLRMLFQIKSKKQEIGYYKINIKKSAYRYIPKDKVKQLKLLSIKSKHTKINFDTKTDGTYVRLEYDSKFIDYQPNKKKKKNKSKKKKKHKSKNIEVDYDKKLLYCPYSDEYIRAHADNLSIDRINNYDTWVDFCIMCGNHGWKDLAHEISKKSSKYDNDPYLINKLLNVTTDTDNLITYKSLLYWSKKDNCENIHKINKKFKKPQKRFKKIFKVHNKLFIELFDEFDYGFDNMADATKCCVDFLEDLDIDKYDTFIIKSGTGTNKTGVCVKFIVELIKKHNYKRINVLSSRVCLVSSLIGRFEEKIYGEKKNRPKNLKMKSYKEVDGIAENLHKEERLVHTIDSTIHMKNEMNQLQFPDILFIDEVESLFNYIINSSTLENRRNTVFNYINQYIIHAKYIFLVDSNITHYIYNYIVNLRKGCKIQLIHNTMKKEINKYYFMKNEFEWMNMIYEDLSNGKKLYISSDYKEKINNIYEDLEIITLDDRKRSIEDMFSRGLINKEEKVKLEEKIDKLLSHPAIRTFFRKGQDIKTEAEILLPDGRTFRPDRLVLDKNKVTIIDYKTGKPEQYHKKQINLYGRLLQDMGYQKIDKQLWYIDEEIKIVTL